MLTESNAKAPQTPKKGLRTRVLKVEWLGQMIASICWMVSVPVYGISSTGDWLQLAAATAWFVANVASLVTDDA